MNLLVTTEDGAVQSVPVSTGSTLTVDDGAGGVNVFSFHGLVSVVLQRDGQDDQRDTTADASVERPQTVRRRKPHAG